MSDLEAMKKRHGITATARQKRQKKEALRRIRRTLKTAGEDTGFLAKLAGKSIGRKATKAVAKADDEFVTAAKAAKKRSTFERLKEHYYDEPGEWYRDAKGNKRRKKKD